MSPLGRRIKERHEKYISVWRIALNKPCLGFFIWYAIIIYNIVFFGLLFWSVYFTFLPEIWLTELMHIFGEILFQELALYWLPTLIVQKQSSRGVLWKKFSWKFAIFTRKHLCWSLFLITLLKIDPNTTGVFMWILRNF